MLKTIPLILRSRSASICKCLPGDLPINLLCLLITVESCGLLWLQSPYEYEIRDTISCLFLKDYGACKIVWMYTDACLYKAYLENDDLGHSILSWFIVFLFQMPRFSFLLISQMITGLMREHIYLMSYCSQSCRWYLFSILERKMFSLVQ